MQYMLMYFEPAAEFAKRVDPAEAPAYWGAWNAYLGAMNQAGIVVSGNGLHPPQMSTTVRLRGGTRQVQDKGSLSRSISRTARCGTKHS